MKQNYDQSELLGPAENLITVRKSWWWFLEQRFSGKTTVGLGGHRFLTTRSMTLDGVGTSNDRTLRQPQYSGAVLSGLTRPSILQGKDPNK